MAKSKRPKTEKNPPAGQKRPRIKEPPGRTDGEHITWHVRSIDTGGPFGWHHVALETIWQEVWAKARDFETMTWHDIKQTSQHHPVTVDRLSKAARKRLEEIGQEDVDELFSLRLTGRQRLWGIRDRHIFKVLWFDPEHKVCPSQKKHT